MNKKRQLIYFPYLKYITPIDINYFGISLCDSSQLLADQRITDEDKNFINNLLNSNIVNDVPIENIFVVTFSKKRPCLKPLDTSEYKLFDEFKKILFICSISSSNTKHQRHSIHLWATTENFIPVFQNFTSGKSTVSYSSGGIINIMDGGYELDEISFEKPRHVLINEISFDDILFKKIKKVKKIDIKFFRSLMLAIESFMHGFYNSNDVSNESRILEQTRAFEILFNLPDIDQRKIFKEKIAMYCRLNSERLYKYKYEAKKGKKDGIGSIHEIWADRFYTLRNHIIHGEKINNKELKFKSQPHFYIALLFFIVAIKQLINEKLNSKIFYEIILYKNKKFQIDTQLNQQILDKLKKTGISLTK